MTTTRPDNQGFTGPKARLKPRLAVPISALLTILGLSIEHACAGVDDTLPDREVPTASPPTPTTASVDYLGIEYNQVSNSSIEIRGIAAFDAEQVVISLTPVKKGAKAQLKLAGTGKQSLKETFTDLDCRTEYVLTFLGVTKAAKNDLLLALDDHSEVDAAIRHSSAIYPIALTCEPPWAAVDFSREFPVPDMKWHVGSVLSVTIPERDEDATFHVFAGKFADATFWYHQSARANRGLTAVFGFKNLPFPVQIAIGKQVGTRAVQGPTFFLNVDPFSTSEVPNSSLQSYSEIYAHRELRGDSFAIFDLGPGVQDLNIFKIEGPRSEWKQVGPLLILTGLSPGQTYAWTATADTWGGNLLSGSLSARPLGAPAKALGEHRAWWLSESDTHLMAIPAREGQITGARLNGIGALASLDFLSGINVLRFNQLECGRTYGAEILQEVGQTISHSFTTEPCPRPTAELILEEFGATELRLRVNARSAHRVKLEIGRGPESEPHIETLGTFLGPASASFLAKDLKCGTGYRVAVACQLPNGNVNCSPEELFWTDGCSGADDTDEGETLEPVTGEGEGASGPDSAVSTISAIDTGHWLALPFMFGALVLIWIYSRITPAIGQARDSGNLLASFHHISTQLKHNFRIDQVIFDTSSLEVGKELQLAVSVTNSGLTGSCVVRAGIFRAYPPYTELATVDLNLSPVKEIRWLERSSWNLSLLIPASASDVKTTLVVEVLNPPFKHTDAPSNWRHRFHRRTFPLPVFKVIVRVHELERVKRYLISRLSAEKITVGELGEKQGSQAFIFEGKDDNGKRICIKAIEDPNNWRREKLAYDTLKGCDGIPTLIFSAEPSESERGIICYEWVEGEPLSELRNQKVTVEAAISAIRVLACIETREAVSRHGDLAPENILINGTKVTIIDWGSSGNNKDSQVAKHIDYYGNGGCDLRALGLCFAKSLLTEEDFKRLGGEVHAGTPHCSIPGAPWVEVFFRSNTALEALADLAPYT